MSIPAPTSGPRALATLTDRQIFDYLCLRQPATRTDIADSLGLSKPTASQGILRLQENGLVSSVAADYDPKAAVRRGRAPESYGINQDFGHLLGLSLEAGTLLGRTTDLSGRTLADAHLAVPTEASAAAVQQLAADMVQELIAASAGQTLAAGVSQSSPVQRAGEQSTALPTPVYAGSSASVAPLVREQTGAPTSLDNDVNWMAQAQIALDAGRAAGSFVLLYVGPGIGTALVIDSKVHRGASGTAGELSAQRFAEHTFLERLRAAGLTEAGSSRVDCARLLRALSGKEPDDHLVAGLTELLADVLGNLLAFFDPHRLVLCGPLAPFESFTIGLQSALARRMGLGRTEFEVSTLGEDAALRGALHGARSKHLVRLWSSYRAEAV
ncbi:ROK family protein [Glutamicibacter sp. 287]|uniref:ROK family transcriptional regulator n=1 Tax=unclassified Glutamicibacter TaxID=2627139 RepID=UPI001142E130|nr:ROK family transcriptional regulator [Glutamicibacter sp. BW80]